jgi:hypothetical protein
VVGGKENYRLVFTLMLYKYRRKTTGFRIIILLLTFFDGIMGCRRNGLSE